MKIQFTSKFNILILCLVTVFVFSSCNSDDDGNSVLEAIELPSNVLGDYTGTLFDDEGEVVIINNIGLTTATITETNSKTYKVSLPDNTSVDGLVFTISTPTDTNPNAIFSSVNTSSIVVVGENALTVSKPDKTEPLFGGANNL